MLRHIHFFFSKTQFPFGNPTPTDSPYHDVSGLPESYMDQVNVDESNAQAQQHLSHSYDDGLQESGYSTPNSRNRRVIREIIV